MNKNVYLITPRMRYVSTRRDKNNNLYLFICAIGIERMCLSGSECVCVARQSRLHGSEHELKRVECARTSSAPPESPDNHTSAIAIRLPPHLAICNQGTREYFDSHNIRVDLNASSTFSNLTTTTTTSAVQRRRRQATPN